MDLSKEEKKKCLSLKQQSCSNVDIKHRFLSNEKLIVKTGSELPCDGEDGKLFFNTHSQIMYIRVCGGWVPAISQEIGSTGATGSVGPTGATGPAGCPFQFDPSFVEFGPIWIGATGITGPPPAVGTVYLNNIGPTTLTGAYLDSSNSVFNSPGFFATIPNAEIPIYIVYNPTAVGSNENRDTAQMYLTTSNGTRTCGVLTVSGFGTDKFVLANPPTISLGATGSTGSNDFTLTTYSPTVGQDLTILFQSFSVEFGTYFKLLKWDGSAYTIEIPNNSNFDVTSNTSIQLQLQMIALPPVGYNPYGSLSFIIQGIAAESTFVTFILQSM
jgi:hypothetical protein